MKAFFVITQWEFFRSFKSRSFLLATFVSPLLFALMILFPTLFLENPDSNKPHYIGCVELDSTTICQKIQKRFETLNSEKPDEVPIRILPIKTDTSAAMKERFLQIARMKHELDSLQDAYNKIKERRKYIFQKPRTRKRERLLRETYEQLSATREARDLAQLDYQKARAHLDSLWQMEIIRNADNLLRNQVVEGYLLIDPEEFSRGIVEFHSLLPASFLQIGSIKQAVQIVMVEERMRQEGLRVSKIQELLKPVTLREIQLQGEQKQEFDFMITYIGPIIVVLFLFISIFTSSGFLFNGVLKEKTNRVIEILLSSVHHTQLVAGKIFGLGLLGIFQILIWFGLTVLLIGLNVLNTGEISFLTLRNAGIFLLYFVLGYLFYATVFVGIGSLFSSEEDAHHLNQFMRMLSIFPIVLAILVLESPNSLVVRILSFIPPLTPTFMILRIPMGNPPIMDYYISVGIMLASILIGTLFAGRLFKIGSLMYGRRPRPGEILRLLFSRL